MSDFISLTANPVFYRTYSRKQADGTRESWAQVCKRTINSLAKLGSFTKEEKELVYQMQSKLFSLCSGRWLWVGGTPWLDNPENVSGAYNCLGGSTKVYTEEYKLSSIKDLAEKRLPVTVINGLGQKSKVTFKSHGVQNTWILHLRRGVNSEYDVVTTPDHQWVLADNSRKQTHELRGKEELKTLNGDRWFVIEPIPTEIEQEVYCCEEPNDHSFLLQGGLITGNCTSTNLTDYRAFALLMDLAMQGCGTGAVLEDKYINQLPPIKNRLRVQLTGVMGGVPKEDRSTKGFCSNYSDSVVSITVGDSRHGWVDAYAKLFELATLDNIDDNLILVSVDISHVRPSGEPLEGFGGVANPVKLPELFSKVANILNKAIGRQLTSVECCLLIDQAATTVVAGNIRRCLPAGTMVKTYRGDKPIEMVRVGDHVLTSKGYYPVTELLEQGKQDLWQLTVGDKILECTGDHKIAVLDKSGDLSNYSMVECQELDAATDQLFVCDDNEDYPQFSVGTITNIAPNLRKGLTYDLSVATVHEFFANNILVSNSAGMRQFDSHDELAKVAKDNLWQQSEEGDWRIDPERDALRMANHTIVYHHKPTEEECIASVKKQFYSGEGAIQWAGEAIARSNADLLNTPEKKREFIRAYEKGKGEEILTDEFATHGKRITRTELDHRMERYGLNPCLAGDTLVLTAEGSIPIKDLVGKTITIWDGNQWVENDAFRVTGKDQPVLKITFTNGESIKATPNHEFFELIKRLDSGKTLFFPVVKRKAKDLKVGSSLSDHPYFPKLGEYEYAAQKDFVISSIEQLEELEPFVYCTTVSSTHSFGLGNGLMSGNCGEIIGSDFFCNLQDIHLNQISPSDFQTQREAFTAAGLGVAALLNHKFPEPRYQKSRDLDPIVGVSFTGLFDFFVNAFGLPWLKWWEAGRPEVWGEEFVHVPLGEVFTQSIADMMSQGEAFRLMEQEYLTFWRLTVEQTIKDYCQRHRLLCPNRYTALQPSGSKSLLTGASPGWHPPKAQRFIRRITFAKNDPVALACIDYGYSVIPSQSDKDEIGRLLDDPFDPRCTEWLVEIPIAVNWSDIPGVDSVDISKFSALAQFDFMMQVQQYYVTHNSSSTLEIRESEIDLVGKRIYKAIQDDEGYISATLLARFDDLQTFPRLPFEPINKETYDHLVAEVAKRKTIDDFHAALRHYDLQKQVMSEIVPVGPAGCDSDKCLLPEKKPS